MKRLFTLLSLILLTICAMAQLDCTNTIICDNFDSYVEGALGPQAAHWTTWSGDEGGAEDGIVSTDYAYSGTHSFKITGQNGPQDVILLLGNKTSGNYRLDFKMYIFAGQRGYWNLQKDEEPAVQWGQEVYFAEDGTGSIDAGGAAAATFTFPHDEWFDVTQFMDLDNDRASLFIAGQAVHSWQFSLSAQAASTPIKQIGAIDFFATDAGNHLYYIDDVRFMELPANDATKRMVQFNVDLSLEDAVSPTGVFLAGEFNDWDPTALKIEAKGNNLFQGYVAVDDLTTYSYKFINGDEWENVPEACGLGDGFGGFNRALTVDTADQVLAAVCMNYCVACSEVSSTIEKEMVAELSLSPNPAHHAVVINYALNAAGSFEMQILNLMGQPVCDQNILQTRKGTVEIDLHGIPAGMYWVQLNNGARQVCRKLIVQ